MAANNLAITGDNYPKDSGNRYGLGWYDPVGNNFVMPYALPVSGTVGGLAIGHMHSAIQDTITSTGSLSSGVNIAGWSRVGLQTPAMGSGCEIQFQFSALNGWANIATNRGVAYSATGAGGYSMGFDTTFLGILEPFQIVRLSASQNQTAARTFTWYLST